jgi:hypothetical protein
MRQQHKQRLLRQQQHKQRLLRQQQQQLVAMTPHPCSRSPLLQQRQRWQQLLLAA